ncbi:MAG: 16S rRNA (cytosine(967)-C(5))-methyltransferase RsmB [Blastocatellales bacterium]
MKVSVTREAAFDILFRVLTGDAYATNLIASERYAAFKPEDRGLMQELVLGVLRNLYLLDWLIERHSKRKIAKLDAEVAIALRLGMYQLQFLTRVPAYAAINESVNLVRMKRKQSAAPMVNAVLRAAQREGKPDLTRLIEEPIERLRIETSHPAWLLERWIGRLGHDEARELALADNRPPRQTFRFNERRQSRSAADLWLKEHGVETRNSDIARGARVVVGGSLTAKDKPVNDGWIYLQDEASQLVARLCADGTMTGPGGMLDLCAAPGGKSTLAASLLPAGSTVTACELHPHRLRTMCELAGRLGIENIEFVELDATRSLPFPPHSFDLVLLDAPCSGLGTLQRHPEIRYRIEPGKIGELAELQKSLLAQADLMVRPGGLIVYAVCSTEPGEGEELIAEFRSSRPDYRDLTRERLTGIGIDPETFLTGSHGARTWPHRHGTEGFFFCALWKRERPGPQS